MFFACCFCLVSCLLSLFVVDGFARAFLGLGLGVCLLSYLLGVFALWFSLLLFDLGVLPFCWVWLLIYLLCWCLAACVSGLYCHYVGLTLLFVCFFVCFCSLD